MSNFIPHTFCISKSYRSIDKLMMNKSTLVGSVNLLRKADPNVQNCYINSKYSGVPLR